MSQLGVVGATQEGLGVRLWILELAPPSWPAISLLRNRFPLGLSALFSIWLQELSFSSLKGLSVSTDPFFFLNHRAKQLCDVASGGSLLLTFPQILPEAHWEGAWWDRWVPTPASWLSSQQSPKRFHDLLGSPSSHLQNGTNHSQLSQSRGKPPLQWAPGTR